MSALTNIIRKELKEQLTPTTIAPMLAMAVLFAAVGGSIGGIRGEEQSQPVIGIVDHDAGVLGNMSRTILLANALVYYNGTNVTAGLAAVERRAGQAVILIPANFTTAIFGDRPGGLEVYWVMKGAGILDSVSSGAVETLLDTVNRKLSEYLIGTNANLSPAVILSPTMRTDTTYFESRVMRGVSPAILSNVLASQSTIVPVVIGMVVIMAGSIVITSMGMEKENKTLETLLTLPLSRRSIVAGKLLASAIVGLLMAGIYMAGFGYYVGSLSGNSPINLAAYGLALTPLDYVFVGASLFASLFAALALCMVLGTSAKNYKSAQTLTMPITVLALFPMFLTIFMDFNTMPTGLRVVIFLIPFSHPMMAMRALMFGDYLFVLAGIAYSLLFAIAMVFVTVWVFRTDRLLTGRLSRRGPRAASGRRLLERVVPKNR